MTDVNVRRATGTLADDTAPATTGGDPGASPGGPGADSPARWRARGPVRVLAPVVVTCLLTTAATLAGLWFAPFAVGVALGALSAARGRRRAGAVACAAVAAVVGWTAPLLLRALDGQPVLSTARAVAALAGLPPSGWVVVVAALLVALVQALLGVWLARALASVLRRRGGGPTTAPTEEVA